MWAKDGPKRLVIAGAFKSKTVRHILAQFGYTGPKIDQSPKQVRQLNRKVEYRKRNSYTQILYLNSLKRNDFDIEI